MSEVKRLKLYHSKHEDMTYPVEAENGSFVLHSDYTTLLARHNVVSKFIIVGYQGVHNRIGKTGRPPVPRWTGYFWRNQNDYT